MNRSVIQNCWTTVRGNRDQQLPRHEVADALASKIATPLRSAGSMSRLMTHVATGPSSAAGRTGLAKPAFISQRLQEDNHCFLILWSQLSKASSGLACLAFVAND